MSSDTVPSSPVECGTVVDQLGATDNLDRLADPAAAAHLATCLRCQAELAAHRRLRRTLRSLASAPGGAPVGLETDLLAALDAADSAPGGSRVPAVAATIGGLAAAAGAIAMVSRHRRVVRLAG